MSEDDTPLYVLLFVLIVTVVGVGVAAASFVTHESLSGMMGGGMMGRGTTSSTVSPPGTLEWGILLVSAAFLVVAAVLLVRAWTLRRAAAAPATSVTAPAARPTPATSTGLPPAAATGPAPADSSVTVPSPSATVASAPLAEPVLVKLLGDDERRMYLELRDHGGQMYQRDLVALGIFSKAKVTRVLDKLEAKGLVRREAHGMTNRIRLVSPPAR